MFLCSCGFIQRQTFICGYFWNGAVYFCTFICLIAHDVTNDWFFCEEYFTTLHILKGVKAKNKFANEKKQKNCVPFFSHYTYTWQPKIKNSLRGKIMRVYRKKKKKKNTCKSSYKIRWTLSFRIYVLTNAGR